MNRSWLIVGMTLAAALDASSGVIIAHLLCLATGGMPTLIIYAAGAGLALSPDLSLLLLACGLKGFDVDHHRELTHYPLLVIPIFLTVVWMSFFWAALISLCLLAHFIDDSADPGGLAWWAPFAAKKYQLGNKEQGPWPLQDWLKCYYLRPTVKSIAAVLFSIAAMSLVMVRLLSED